MRLGLDIGGTKIAGVLLGDDGAVVERSWTPHRARGTEEVAAALTRAARDLTGALDPRAARDPAAGEAVTAVGISISGLVALTGRITEAALLRISDVDLGARIAAELGCVVRVVNDADATLVAASCEDTGGAPVTDAVLLALGTGVGGAVLSGGRLVQGPTGYAGELGHLPIVDPLGYPCLCGSSGCLEQLASGRGLAERAVRLPSREASELAGAAGVPVDGLTSIHVVAAARAGRPPAVRLVSEAAQALGHALALLTVTFEPSVIYLAGSLAHAAEDLLIPDATARLHRQLPFADVRRAPRIRLDDLGPTAAAVGAARLAADPVAAPRSVHPSVPEGEPR